MTPEETPTEMAKNRKDELFDNKNGYWDKYYEDNPPDNNRTAALRSLDDEKIEKWG